MQRYLFRMNAPNFSADFLFYDDFQPISLVGSCSSGMSTVRGCFILYKHSNLFRNPQSPSPEGAPPLLCILLSKSPVPFTLEGAPPLLCVSSPQGRKKKVAETDNFLWVLVSGYGPDEFFIDERRRTMNERRRTKDDRRITILSALMGFLY